MATANTVMYNGVIPESVGPVGLDGQQAVVVPDRFASYFPVTITGGTTNPMVGADLVQGANPQDLGLDSILTAIQSQYTPQTFTHSGGSYGAQRFINLPDDFDGVYPSVTAGNVATPWYTPTEFNLADYQTTITPELSEQIATGGVYGGDSYSPVSNVGNEAWVSNPYAGLDPMTGLRSGVNALIPGAGLLIGAAQGYAGATSANTLNDVLNYLGDEGLGTVDPTKAALLGAFGITPQSLKDAQEFYAIFDQNPSTMLNWAAYPVDTASNQIVDFMMEGAQNPLSPQDIGVMSWAVRADIDQAVVAGKSLTDAVRDVAISKGVDPTRAAEMGVAASRSAVTQGLQKGLSLEDMDPAAVAVYNDPLGALIDALGITGRIDESINTALGALDYATPDDISEALAGLDFATADDITTALSGLDYSTPDDISEALAGLDFATAEDIQTALSGLDYSTPDDISEALAGLNFATAEDIATALSGLDYSTPDDISEALAGLNFATSEDITTALSGLNYATADDIVNALADLNYTTPEYIDSVLADLNFSTPQDVADALADAGLASTDDISNAIAGLDIPTVDDIISAIATPVTETPLQPTTDLPPAGGSIDDFGGTGSDVTVDSGIGSSDFFNLPEGVQTPVDFVTYVLTPTEGGTIPTEQDVADVLASLPDLTAEDRDQIIANVSSFVQPSGGQFFLTDSQGNYVTAAGQAYQSEQDALQAVANAGGSVTRSEAEAIANNTLDPIAAMNAIAGWTVPDPTPAPPVSSGSGGGGDYSSYSGAGESQTAASLSGDSEYYG